MIKLIKAIKWKIRTFSEKIYRVDFSSVVYPEKIGFDPLKVNHSSPSGNKFLKTVLKNLKITENDSIIDIGCGKGSAMRVMLDFPFQRVDGVEISEKLCQIAKNNFTKLGKKNVTIFNFDAAEMCNYNAYNMFYFYNPFPCEIMEKVINNILDSNCNYIGNRLIVIYDNPVCHELFKKYGFSKISDYPDYFGNRIYVYSSAKEHF